MSHCRVDAAGIPAEWVETAVASEGQPTIVYFVTDGSGADALERSRRSAHDLARADGARVLTVACRQERSRSSAAAVEAGLAAYGWLLREGCDVALTAFAEHSAGAGIAEAVLAAAGSRGLPLPAGCLRMRPLSETKLCSF